MHTHKIKKSRIQLISCDWLAILNIFLSPMSIYSGYGVTYILFVFKQILILKRKYFLHNWNNLDFFIIVLGIVDILCLHFVKLKPNNLVLIQFTVVIGYFRIIRFLPIFKVRLPTLKYWFAAWFTKWFNKLHSCERNERRSCLFQNVLQANICLVGCHCLHPAFTEAFPITPEAETWALHP